METTEIEVTKAALTEAAIVDLAKAPITAQLTAMRDELMKLQVTDHTDAAGIEAARRTICRVLDTNKAFIGYNFYSL